LEATGDRLQGKGKLREPPFHNEVLGVAGAADQGIVMNRNGRIFVLVLISNNPEVEDL
jgi:hypothetical protein